VCCVCVVVCVSGSVCVGVVFLCGGGVFGVCVWLVCVWCVCGECGGVYVCVLVCVVVSVWWCVCVVMCV